MIEFRIFQKYFVRLIVRILFVFFTIVYLKLFNKIAIKYNRSDLTILLLRNIKIFNRAEKPLLIYYFTKNIIKKKSKYKEKVCIFIFKKVYRKEISVEK